MPFSGPNRARLRLPLALAAVLAIAGGCSGTGASPTTSDPGPSVTQTVTPTLGPTPEPTPAFDVARCDAFAGLIDIRPPDPTIPSLPITATIALPKAQDAFSVEPAGGSIWVADGLGGFLHRIDPATGTILATLDIGPAQDVYLAATDDTLWATSMQRGMIFPVDLATSALGSPITVGRAPLGIAIGPNGPLVVSFEDQSLSEIDPASGTVVRTLQIDPDLAAVPDIGPTDIEVIGNDAWVLGHRGRMALRVDLTTFTVAQQACVDVPTPERIEQGDGVLWIASSKESTVARLDLATGKIDARIRLPEPEADVRFVGVWELSLDDGGDLWVAAHSFVARIETDTLELSAWVDLRGVTKLPAIEGAFDVRVVDGKAWIAFSAGEDSKLVVVDIPS